MPQAHCDLHYNAIVQLCVQVDQPVLVSVKVLQVSRRTVRWDTLLHLHDGSVAIEGQALSVFRPKHHVDIDGGHL